MKNPLNKRYFRELKNDFGKYIEVQRAHMMKASRSTI